MKVFISYAFHRNTAGEETDTRTRDCDVAEKICRRLESEGIGCWMAPRDIMPGDSWVEAIIDGVDQSRLLILVFSAAANRSQWVKDEISLALERHLKIIPFGIEAVPPHGTLKILRARCQWIDASTPPLEKHLDHLARAVRTHLDRETKMVTVRKNVKTLR